MARLTRAWNASNYKVTPVHPSDTGIRTLRGRVKMPLMAGGACVGEIVLREKDVKSAVEHLAYCAGPIHRLPTDQLSALLSNVFVAVTKTLQDGSQFVIEHAIWDHVDALCSRRGRPRKVDGAQVPEQHQRVKEKLLPLSIQFEKCRNRAAAWMSFVESDPNYAGRLDEAGLKERWLSPNTPKTDLTLGKLAYDVLACHYETTTRTLRQQRKPSARRRGKINSK